MKLPVPLFPTWIRLALVNEEPTPVTTKELLVVPVDPPILRIAEFPERVTSPPLLMIN
ncbi:MAG: hypothetical protein PCFJNLEI_03946 [Verrucomicrobiae bacterium]|nr:hypothetical protein [Verrucomicrobiae bacterium]